MALQGTEEAIGLFSANIPKLLSYAWVLIPLIIIALLIGIVWFIKRIKRKNSQWTHKVRVRRVGQDGRVTDPVYHRMRRFPLIKKAEVFELENPILGGYLLPEPDEYTGDNEYSIILDKNNRIYNSKGDFFDPDKSSVNVSAKHAEMDIQRSNLRAKFQDINKINKRIEWATIAKYALMIIGIFCITLISIIGIGKWGEAQQYQSQEAQAMENAMTQLSKAMTTVDATVNTQKLEILPMMQEIYKTKNLNPIINLEVSNVSV